MDMPASDGKGFHAILDHIAQTVGDEDAVQQDSTQPDQSETATFHMEMETERNHTSLATGTSNNPPKSCTHTGEQAQDSVCGVESPKQVSLHDG